MPRPPGAFLFRGRVFRKIWVDFCPHVETMRLEVMTDSNTNWFVRIPRTEERFIHHIHPIRRRKIHTPVPGRSHWLRIRSGEQHEESARSHRRI